MESRLRTWVRRVTPPATRARVRRAAADVLERVSEGAQRLGQLAESLRPALPAAPTQDTPQTVAVTPTVPPPPPPPVLAPEDLGWALARHVSSAWGALADVALETPLRGDDYDAELVRRMRIGSRRLRSALTIFGPWVAKKRRRRLETALKQITSALGPLRDLDVVLANFEASADHDALRIAAAEHVRAQLAAPHRRARKRAAKALRGLDHDAVGAALAQVRRQIVERLTADADIRPALLQELERCVTEAFDETPVPTTLDDREAVHEVRILAKQLRYVHEWIKPALQHAPGPKRMLKRAQRAVGDTRDLDLFAQQLSTQRDILEADGQDTLATALGGWHDEIIEKRARADRKVLPALANLDPRALIRLDHDALGVPRPT